MKKRDLGSPLTHATVLGVEYVCVGERGGLDDIYVYVYMCICIYICIHTPTDVQTYRHTDIGGNVRI